MASNTAAMPVEARYAAQPDPLSPNLWPHPGAITFSDFRNYLPLDFQSIDDDLFRQNKPSAGSSKSNVG
ncbi:MAG: hypothetical protein ABJQ70_17485 [Roseobacter sp.]